VYLSAQPAASLTSLAAWGEPTASAGDVTGASHSFTVAATRAGAVLVWFTRLPAGDGGQTLQVSEITVG
jgi:hypothetical protein